MSGGETHWDNKMAAMQASNNSFSQPNLSTAPTTPTAYATAQFQQAMSKLEQTTVDPNTGHHIGESSGWDYGPNPPEYHQMPDTEVTGEWKIGDDPIANAFAVIGAIGAVVEPSKRFTVPGLIAAYDTLVEESPQAYPLSAFEGNGAPSNGSAPPSGPGPGQVWGGGDTDTSSAAETESECGQSEAGGSEAGECS